MRSDNEFWFCGWDNAPPHLQRYIYAGRIFCFKFNENTYCFGRIMTKTLVGYIAEIFDHTSPLPEIDAETVLNAKRLDVVILDTINLFERNKDHNWRIIGDHRNYVPENVDGICYRIGTENKKVDFFGKITEVFKKQAEELAPFVPLGDDEVKKIIAPKIGKEYIPGKPKKKKPDLEIRGWDKKPRTMLRYLDAGQIFCFKFDENKYCFGRLMTEASVGHIAEIFDYTASTPEIGADEINSAKRISVEVLDSYSLFDRKSEGDWRIIGACGNYIPTDVENIIFYFGIGSGTQLVDFFDHKTPVPPEEAMKYPPLSPHGDYEIKTKISEKIK